MEGLKENGHDNYLMCPQNSIISKRSITLVSSYIPFQKGILARFRNIIALVKICKSNNIDLVHGHDSHAHTLLWLAYKFGGLKTKSIITRRLINPIKNRSLDKYNYAKIERIICISEAVKNVLFPKVVDHNRLIVIHSAIKIHPKLPIDERNIKNSSFVIGYVAAFTEEKDHTTFLKVANNLIGKYPDKKFEFLLVGDGPLLEHYKSESKKIKGKFEFTGFIKNMDQAYSKIDLLLHTSKSEALGTAILDAMEHGLPIVATNVGGIPEIVKNEQNGFICEIGDFNRLAASVYKIAINKTLYDSFSSNSNKMAKNFDAAIMVKRTMELYQDVING
jgi:glycosyltransferase involved in cell wall biosynthesis